MAGSGNRDMHAYRKALFPALREKRFVRGHRRTGHKVRHFGMDQQYGFQVLGRCYWRCDCGARYWC